MPKITRVTGPWLDGVGLPATSVSKDLFHYGREAGFDGTKGGLEIINGQLDFDGNFDINEDGAGDDTIGARHVRRGTFTQGPVVSGFRQSRDVWYKTFPDLSNLTTPDMYEQASVVLAKTWENRTLVDSVLFDITVDYTVASNQNFGGPGAAEPADSPYHVKFDNPPIKGFVGVWINDVLIEGTATPLAAGRSSTVKPWIKAEEQFYNYGVAPDFRTFAVKLRLSQRDLVAYPGLTSLMATGWHNLSVRVSGNQTIRVHGGAVIVTPIR